MSVDGTMFFGAVNRKILLLFLLLFHNFGIPRKALSL